VKADTVAQLAPARSDAVDSQLLSWPAAIAGGVVSGLLGGVAVAVVACAALVIWLLVRAIPRGAIVVPGILASWAAVMGLFLM
jgi:hypothetical protein